MMNNENNDAVGSSTWNSSQGLGFSVLQRHNKAFGHLGGGLVRNHLGRHRISLAADIYRRYNRNSLSVLSGAELPFANFFSQTSLNSHVGARESLSHDTPWGKESLHRMVNISQHKPHIVINRGLMGVNMSRSAISLAANENSSALIYPSNPSLKSSIVVSNPSVLSHMPHSSHVSKQAIVRRRTGGIGEKSAFARRISSDASTGYAALQELNRFSSPSPTQVPHEHHTAPIAEGRHTPINNIRMKASIPFANVSRKITLLLERFPKPSFSYDNALISVDTGTSGGHLPGSVQRALDRQSRQGFILNPVFESEVARFAPQEHYYPDSKTAPMPDAGVPAISPKAEPSSGIIARQEQTSSEAAQSGNKRLQSSVQRAVSRQNNALSQNHYELRDNNVIKGEPARFAPFAAPLVTVNRKFSLSSGNRFEGLGLGRKIAGHTVGTLSQQGFAADFIPESAIARFAPLEHYYPDSKTALMPDANSGVPAISPKAEPSSGIISRQEQTSSEAAQSGNKRLQSSVQRAVSRQNNALSQNHYEPRDNNVIKGEPARFAGNEWTGRTAPFASPLVTVNRKFSLSSGNRFEGLGLGRKIAGHTVGTLSQQGFAADFIPESAIAGFAPQEHYYPDSKTALMPDASSGVPAISPKVEPPSGIISRQEQTSSEAAQSGNKRLQSSVQRAVSRQNNALSQNHYEPRGNNLIKGEPARFAGNEWTGHTAPFASPLVTVNRKFSLSSGNRFEGLGLGRKIAGHTVGTLSQQGFAADFIPESAIAGFAPLEHFYPDSKTAPMADAVSAISSKAEPSSGIIARQEQTSSEAAQSGNKRSQSSVQRAVDRQSSIPGDRPSQLGMQDMRLDLKTALRHIESGTRHHDSVRRSADIVSRSGENTRFYTVDPLLMRSVVSSPIKVKPLVQMLLGRQLQNTVSRKDGHGQRDITVRHIESGGFSPARANSFATVAGNLTSGTLQPAAIEHREFSYGERAIDSAMRLPLALHSSVQRKTAGSGEQSVAAGDDVSAYLQRQVISNGSLETAPAASAQKIEAVSSQTGKSDSNALSTDDVVDKVWRKLMRKLVSEQERMGGCSRWAN